MSGKRWKVHERAVARALGSERNPSNGKRQADINAGPWAIEHKTRLALPQWFTRMMGQAVAGAKEGETPIAVIDSCAGRGHSTERYVVMRWDDFLEWHGLVARESGRQDVLRWRAETRCVGTTVASRVALRWKCDGEPKLDALEVDGEPEVNALV